MFRNKCIDGIDRCCFSALTWRVIGISFDEASPSK